MSGVKRISLQELKVNITNALIIGIIIAKRSWRKFASVSKNDRAVWSFTLRGSPQDCINVTCWGSVQFIQAIHNSCHIGDVVNLIRPQIKVRNPGDRNENFVPAVNSPYTLSLNEGQSLIELYEGADLTTFTNMLTIPTKKLTGAYCLNDIQTSGSNMRGQQVDILVGIRTIGPIKNIKRKNTDEVVQTRDIIVMDQTNPGFLITLWEEDDVSRSSFWIQRTTVLFMTDVRVEMRNNAPMIILTSQTVITVNPDDPLAKALCEYMKHSAPAPITTPATLNIPLPNPQFIRNVISLAQLNKRTEYFASNPDVEVNFSALVYCFIVELNLDLSRIIVYKCGICNKKIDPNIRICFDLECPVGLGVEQTGCVKEFDILMQLADHTGHTKNVHLEGKSAESVLEFTPNQFETLPEKTRDKIQWDFVLERFEMKLMLVRNGMGKIQVNILSCALVEDYEELAQKLPLF